MKLKEVKHLLQDDGLVWGEELCETKPQIHGPLYLKHGHRHINQVLTLL
jgi:hypothetical protein